MNETKRMPHASFSAAARMCGWSFLDQPLADGESRPERCREIAMEALLIGVAERLRFALVVDVVEAVEEREGLGCDPVALEPRLHDLGSTPSPQVAQRPAVPLSRFAEGRSNAPSGSGAGGRP